MDNLRVVLIPVKDKFNGREIAEEMIQEKEDNRFSNWVKKKLPT